jgi:hypothetical protein
MVLFGRRWVGDFQQIASVQNLARAAGFEPALHGFGDRPTAVILSP